MVTDHKKQLQRKANEKLQYHQSNQPVPASKQTDDPRRTEQSGQQQQQQAL